mgnify:CR=1 FL=1
MKQTERKNKATILLLASWAGIVLLLLIISLKLPHYFTESRRLMTLMAQVSDRQQVESRMNAFINAFQFRVKNIDTAIASRQSKIASSTFSRLPESEMSDFIDKLPNMVASAGVRLINLGYKARETLDGYVDQPFDLQFNGRYPEIRQMLHALETHVAGIRIESLEFASLDDINHEAQLKLQCRVRFKTDG